jgi:peptidoglycan/LPS O-acetylase OafA/YrhL
LAAGGAARYRAFGAYRLALAVMVAVQHFHHLLAPQQQALFSHGGFGAIAVAAFFAVSGFVVAEALSRFYAGRPGAFLFNRVLRLGPPYLAALAVSVAVHAALWRTGRLALWDYTLDGSPLAPARLLTGLLGLVPGFEPRWLGQDFEFVPFVWSLRLEMAFYGAAAAVMAACWRLRAAWPAAAAILLALAGSAAFMLLARRPSVLSTTPMFLLGVALFLRLQRPDAARATLLGLTVCVALAGFLSWRQHGAPQAALQLPVLAAALAVFAWLPGRRIAGATRLWDKRLGDLSYPLYLNHYAAGIAASSLGLRPGWALVAGALGCSLVIALASERLVDRQMRTWRDRVRAAAV